MKACASHLLCDSRRYPDLAAVVTRVREAGFTAIEVGAFERWRQGLSPRRLAEDRAYADESLRILSDSGLAVPSINCAPGPELLRGGPDDVAGYANELAGVTRFAKRVGATHITLQIPAKPDDWTTETTVREYSSRLRAVFDRVAPPESVRFGMETHAGTFMEQPATALRVVTELWPTAGITYDPSHQIMIGIPLDQTLELFQYTNKAHLRDARAGEMQAAFGEGELDADWVLTRLADHGYDDYVTVEYFMDFDPDFVSAKALRSRIESAADTNHTRE